MRLHKNVIVIYKINAKIFFFVFTPDKYRAFSRKFREHFSHILEFRI